MASNQYFGTDGIRGTAGTPPMTPEFCLSAWSSGGARAQP